MANKKKASPEAETEKKKSSPEVAEEKETASPESKKASETKEETSVSPELEKAIAEKEEYLDKLKRSMAEFDNYKKRTQKEKEATFSLATAETVGAFLPLIDNLERFLAAAESDGDNAKAFIDGIGGILKQANGILSDLGVTPIPSVGEAFDPNVHNAVSHIESDEFGENTVSCEFQKGYMLGERVIRHSMVQVAN